MHGLYEVIAGAGTPIGRRAALGGLLGVAGLTLAACGAGAAAAGTGAAATKPEPQVTLEVLNGELAGKYGIVGPDDRGHDTFVPAHFTVPAANPMSVKVLNYDEGPHSFTIDELKVDEAIPARVADGTPSAATFSLTIPRAGTYRFYCKLGCDAGQGGWAMTPDRRGNGMGQDGYMAGYVTAI